MKKERPHEPKCFARPGEHCSSLRAALSNRSERSNGLDWSSLINMTTGKTRDCVVHRERGGEARLVRFCPFCGKALT
jgi:hypothetical protein